SYECRCAHAEANIPRHCPICQIEFTGAKHRKYCSYECFLKSNARWDSVHRVDLTCQHCGETYGRFSSQVSISKFCSAKCKSDHKRNGRNVPCKQCGALFYQVVAK